MEWPKKLIGWVRVGGQGYEVRLSYEEPNLFTFGVEYKFTSIRKAASVIPHPIFFDNNKVPVIRKAFIKEKKLIDRLGTEVKVGDILTIDRIWGSKGYDYAVWNKEGGYLFVLKRKPDNIR